MEFRGWDKVNKCWIENGFPFLVVGQSATEKPYFSISTNPQWELVRGTGVKAMDGLRLWEGDIVRRACFSPDCEPIHIGIVEYDASNGGFAIINHELESNSPLVMYHKNRQIGIERLGNVYEHPELVKTLQAKIAELSTP